MAKRVFFGSTSLAVRPTTYAQTPNASPSLGSWYAPRGVQSVGFSTSVAFEPLFQLGQTELYGRTESQSPEVEATVSKAFDGNQPLYVTMMGGGSAVNNKQPTELSLNHCELELGIYSENVPYASGSPESSVYCSGMYISNVSYTFPIDGTATEEITLVGDTRKWTNSPNVSNFANIPNAGSGEAPAPYQRWTLNVDGSTLPSGVQDKPIQSVSVSMGIGREAIQELGTRGKYCRYATYPFEVTTDFEVIAAGKINNRGASPGNVTSDDVTDEGYDFVNDIGLACFSATKYDLTPGVDPASVDNGEIDVGYRDQEITLIFCGETTSDNLTLALGDKCRLTSQSYSGGDTGGDNVTLSYSFQSYNEFKMTLAGAFLTDPPTV